MIRREEQRLHVFKGQNITLKCSAEGYPLHVRWKKVIGGLEIDVGEVISMNAINSQFIKLLKKQTLEAKIC